MKIVQIMPEFDFAGAETMCETLTYELRKLGHEVVVISMYDYHSPITDRLESAGVCVRYLHKKPGIDLSMIPKMKKVFKEVHADVIHTHRYCAQYAIPAAIMAGVKYRVHTVHNVAEKELGKPKRKLNKFFFQHCNVKPVALSELVRDSIVREYKIKREDIPVILNGSDLSKCIPKDNYEIKENFKILHIGRFMKQKNHAGLLEAFYLFHENHPDTELWLIGDGEKRTEVEEDVRKKGLTENVKFLGSQSHVYQYLHDADIFALPSLYEGVPITLIEAMGTGLPIVATAVGGVPDMLDAESALLVPVEVEKIAQAFEIYYLQGELRRTHGKEAQRRAERFSSVTMAEKYSDLYSKGFETC